MKVVVKTLNQNQYGFEANEYTYKNVIRIIHGFEYDGKEKPIFRLVMLHNGEYSTATFWADKTQIEFEE